MVITAVAGLGYCGTSHNDRSDLSSSTIAKWQTANELWPNNLWDTAQIRHYVCAIGSFVSWNGICNAPSDGSRCTAILLYLCDTDWTVAKFNFHPLYWILNNTNVFSDCHCIRGLSLFAILQNETYQVGVVSLLWSNRISCSDGSKYLPTVSSTTICNFRHWRFGICWFNCL